MQEEGATKTLLVSFYASTFSRRIWTRTRSTLNIPEKRNLFSIFSHSLIIKITTNCMFFCFLIISGSRLGLKAHRLRLQTSWRHRAFAFAVCALGFIIIMAGEGKTKDVPIQNTRQSPWVETVPGFPWRVGGDKFCLDARFAHAACHCSNSGTGPWSWNVFLRKKEEIWHWDYKQDRQRQPRRGQRALIILPGRLSRPTAPCTVACRRTLPKPIGTRKMPWRCGVFCLLVI